MKNGQERRGELYPPRTRFNKNNGVKHRKRGDLNRKSQHRMYSNLGMKKGN
jgi:hypothetical protein